MYRHISEISRTSKAFVVLGLDALVVLVAIFLAIVFRTGNFWPAGELERGLPFLGTMLGLGIVLALVMSLPRIKLSAFDMQTMTQIAVYATMLGVSGTVLNLAADLGVPRTVPLIFGFLLFCLSVGWKLIASQFLNWLRSLGGTRVPVAVYGCGSAGIQLISMLQRSSEFRVVAVVDDNPNLRGVAIGGLRVQSTTILDELVGSGRVRRILLAMPSVSRANQRRILQGLEHLGIEVHALPPYAEMVTSGGLMPMLKPVSTDDLLGREKINLNLPGMAEAYHGRSVLISGAGGSIGSELCRQILKTGVRRLVLFERSELALYEIEQELCQIAAERGVDLVSVLGSITDLRSIRRTFVAHDIEVVLHAAAYKHVPLVEINELEGVRNNVLGTRTLAEAAEEAGVERFILISTDKAVRPTNVMGATKRLAEMVVQDLACRAKVTRFTMVRFGNVLGSSGSVIPLFQRQITAGGPVTVTDPEVTRFFMTVPEAAQLVLLAGSYSQGGEVFVLDMGKPVKIMDLAHQVIEMSGLTVRGAANPDGDIEIVITGLRPGEKLYEELLIGEGGLLETPHPKILRANENCPSSSEIIQILGNLEAAVATDSITAARQQIAIWVEGYQNEGATQMAAE